MLLKFVHLLIFISGQFISTLVSKERILESCHTPSTNEKITNTFKVRLDVYKPIKGLLNTVSVSIRGKEVVQNVYKSLLFSSVSYD
jgi:hypothetical protein